MNYKNTTQVVNILFDDLLKTINSISELKVLLTIIRKTTGKINPSIPGQRIEKAWISQKLFMVCCSLSGKAVSNAIDRLVIKGYIEVTNEQGNILRSKKKRRGASRLYYASRLRLVPNKKQANKSACDNPVNLCHTIKLNNSKQSCYNTTHGVKKLTDRERYLQIIKNQPIKHIKDTH